MGANVGGRAISKSMNLLNAYGELGYRTAETVNSPITPALQYHHASHAPPAAPAPGFSQATLVGGELPQ